MIKKGVVLILISFSQILFAEETNYTLTDNLNYNYKAFKARAAQIEVIWENARVNEVEAIAYLPHFNKQSLKDWVVLGYHTAQTREKLKAAGKIGVLKIYYSFIKNLKIYDSKKNLYWDSKLQKYYLSIPSMLSNNSKYYAKNLYLLSLAYDEYMEDKFLTNFLAPTIKANRSIDYADSNRDLIDDTLRKMLADDK